MNKKEEIHLIYKIFKGLQPVKEIQKKIDPIKDIELWSNPEILYAQIKQDYMIETMDNGGNLNVYYTGHLVKVLG